MKSIFTAFIFLFSSLTFADEVKPTYEPANLINQATYGCEFAESIEKSAETEFDINKQTCDPYLNEVFSDQLSIINNAIFDGMMVVAFIAIFIGIYVRVAKGTEGFNAGWPNYILYLSVSFILVFPFLTRHSSLNIENKYSVSQYILHYFFKRSSDEANRLLNEANSYNLYSFPDIYIPQYEKYTGLFENVIEYFNTVNGIVTDNKVVFSVVEDKNDLKAISHYNQYYAEIKIPLDQNCIALADKYKLLDCREKQIEWYKQYLSAAFAYSAKISQNFLNNFDGADGETYFDINMPCENLDTLELTKFSKEDLEYLYLVKGAACASRIFTEGMHKFQSLTTDEYLNNKNHLKSRRITLCMHDESASFKSVGLTRKEAKDRATSCVKTACGDAGSPYFCSAAVATYHSLHEDTKFDWLHIPAYVMGSVIDTPTTNAEVFGSKFDFTYYEFENQFAVNKKFNPLWIMEFELLKEKKTVSYSYFERMKHWVSDKWQKYTGFDVQFNTEQFNSIGLIGKDGFWGLERLDTCLRNPRQHVDGWNCGSPITEIIKTGLRNIKSAVNSIVASYASLPKTKGTTKASKSEIADAKNFLNKVIPTKEMAIIGYFAGVSSQINIYDEAEIDLTEAVKNSAIILASTLGGESLKNAIMNAEYAKLFFGFTLAFLIPTLLLYKFVRFLVLFLTNTIIHLIMSVWNFTEAALSNGSMVNSYSRKDLDIPDFVVNFFLIFLTPIALVIGAVMLTFTIETVFSILPISLFEVVSRLTMTPFSGSSNALVDSDLFHNIFNGVFYGFLLVMLMKLIIDFFIQTGTLLSWLWFGNGELDTRDEGEHKHNEIFSKLK